MFYCPESNEVLKLKFRNLHTTVVNIVNPANIMDFLFQECVVGQQDMNDLLQKDNKQLQTRSLLNLLHASENPQAFVKLYAAIKEESHLQWLIDRVDSFDRQTLIGLLQELYISEPTGEPWMSAVNNEICALGLRTANFIY